MKKTVIALAILAAASTAFAETSTTTDCGTSPSCVSMGDATSSDNTVSQINPTTASNGNDLSNDNTVKTNITGGNTTSTGGTTTSTGGTNTATGGTYTTGALSAQGGSIGNTDNASSATTGASTSSIGNTSTGGNSLVGGTQTSSTGASTSSTGAVTVNPNNTNGQSLADNSTRNTASQATGGSVGNTSTGASTSSTGAVTLTPTNTQGLTDASTRNTQQQQSLTSGAVTVTPTSNQNTTAHNNAQTGSNTSTTNVDAADRSSTVYQSLAYALPDMPAVVATNLATAQMTKTVGVCGPLVTIHRDQVTGVYQGLVFKSRIDQGHDDSVEAFVDNEGNEQLFKVVNVAGRQMLSGHQLHITSAVISLGGARQLGIGGGSVNSDYGQASAGSSSQTQRLVTNVQAVPCVVGVLEAAPVHRIKG